MAKPVIAPKFKKKKGPRRLLRYLEKGDKLVIIGVRGKPVKKVVPGRKYVLEVKRKGKFYGYINNTKKKTVTKKVRGKKVKKETYYATPQSFTKSMVARLVHTRQVKGPGPIIRKSKEKVTLVSNRRVTSQITKRSRLIREIKENSGSAFNLRFEYNDGERIESNRVYYGDDGMGDDDLKNLVLSNFFTMLGTNNLRISDRLNKDSTKINSRRRLVSMGELSLEFSDV